MQHLTSS